MPTTASTPFSREALFSAIAPDLLLDSAGLTPRQLVTKAPAINNALGQIARASVANTIQTTLSRRSPAAAQVLEKVDLTPDLKTPNKAHAAVLAKIESAGASAEIVAEATQRLQAFDIPQALAAIEQPDLPIGQNPLLAGEISMARLHRLGRLAGVPAATMEKVRTRGLTAAALNDHSLSAAVTDGVLTAKDAERVACATGIFRLVDENTDLTAVGIGDRPRIWKMATEPGTDEHKGARVEIAIVMFSFELVSFAPTTTGKTRPT